MYAFSLKVQEKIIKRFVGATKQDMPKSEKQSDTRLVRDKESTSRRTKRVMNHKYRGSNIVLSISKSVEPNEEQKEMASSFQQGILWKY